MSNTTSVKPLRYAASLIFACHTPIHQNASSIQQDFKILFMTRNKKGSFAGLTVFPGGAVEACDADPSWIPTSLPHHHHTPRNMKSNSYQTAITAIRETFEETGILLTHTIDQSLLESTTRPVIAHMDRVTRLAWRDKVHHDPTLFKHLCKSTQTYPSLNRLVYWDKWVTPKLEPVRFDTDFYLAAINDPMESLQYMQLAEADGQEATSISWMTPIEALNKFKKKGFFLLLSLFDDYILIDIYI